MSNGTIKNVIAYFIKLGLIILTAPVYMFFRIIGLVGEVLTTVSEVALNESDRFL